ncbi:MAG TPA: hypothetical protein VFU15_13135 [Bacteroidia bacterium]|nr:hypothetical protein [Bacteroidia bacterium]
MLKKILVSVFILLPFFLAGQADTAKFSRSLMPMEKDISLLLGINYWHWTYGEVGVAKNSFTLAGVHPFASAVFISDELKMDDHHFVMGPKIGGWIAGGASAMALGINAIYYTDFSAGSLRLRPEIGIGMGPFKVVYGYNLRLTGKYFPYVNSNVVSAVFLIGLKKGTTAM